jgi:hypothetical protein
MHDMAACPLLDDLFNWGTQTLAAGGRPTVQCNLVTNQSTFKNKDKNIVCYGEGTLVFQPGRWERIRDLNFFFPPSFAGSLTLYYSDRRYSFAPSPPPDDLIHPLNYPFDANNTVPLDLNILGPVGSYSASIQLPKYNITDTFTPQCEAGVIYAILGGIKFVVISLCERTSNITQ